MKKEIRVQSIHTEIRHFEIDQFSENLGLGKIPIIFFNPVGIYFLLMKRSNWEGTMMKVIEKTFQRNKTQPTDWMKHYSYKDI